MNRKEAKIEKQIQDEKDEKEDTCCKCGACGGSMYARHRLRYDPVNDRLVKICFECGYNWEIKPKDAKDET